MPVMSEQLMNIDEIIFGYDLFLDKVVYYRDLRLSKEPSAEEVIKELEDCDLSKYDEVVFAGIGEPLMRLDAILKITNFLANRGVQVRLDTIGHAKFLYPERNVAMELANIGMKKVSVSLNAHDEVTYNQLCRPKFKNAYSMMLEFAMEIIKTEMGLRFTIVDLPIINTEKCRQIAQKYGSDFMVRTIS
jgi:TatD family-associated radical SAM protein